MGQLSHDSS
jgi:hypothetical protein